VVLLALVEGGVILGFLTYLALARSRRVQRRRRCRRSGHALILIVGALLASGTLPEP
jgi:hypothetical protein